MAEKYFLMPGNVIGKKGLPGGKLECRKGKEPLEIKPNLVEVIKKNIGFFISQGIVFTGTKLNELAEKAEKEEAGKEISDKMKALIEEAEASGLEVPEKISQKELKVMIQEKIEADKAEEAPGDDK